MLQNVSILPRSGHSGSFFDTFWVHSLDIFSHAGLLAEDHDSADYLLAQIYTPSAHGVLILTFQRDACSGASGYCAATTFSMLAINCAMSGRCWMRWLFCKCLSAARNLDCATAVRARPTRAWTCTSATEVARSK